MGAGFSQAFPCFNPAVAAGSDQFGARTAGSEPDPLIAASSNDETLGHSFCYVRSSARFVSPIQSDRFDLSPNQSLRFDNPSKPSSNPPETGFRAISGASVGANTSTPITVVQFQDNPDDSCNANAGLGSSGVKGFVGGPYRGNSGNVMLEGFESTASFTALPLQRLPRGSEGPSGPLERAFFMSGPIERGAMSGPLESIVENNNSSGGGVPFSAPLGGMYMKKKRRKKSLSGIKKALYRNFSVVPVRSFIGGGGKREVRTGDEGGGVEENKVLECESNVQWALGKAGEDRVHVVVSEELGWLFVGIYDGFNGPDAPEFLMSHLYKAMYRELEGLFWETESNGGDGVEPSETKNDVDSLNQSFNKKGTAEDVGSPREDVTNQEQGNTAAFGVDQIEVKRRRLWEYLVEDETEDGLDLSGSDRFAFSVNDALSVNNAGSHVSRSLLLSKLKHGLLSRHNKDKEPSTSFPWKFWLEGKRKTDIGPSDGNVSEGRELDAANRTVTTTDVKKRKEGLVDHESVLSAMARALEATERGYLDMTDSLLDRYAELALMGSCLLVVLMRDEDVYVMNVGDSRAIVAQCEQPEEVSSGAEARACGHGRSNSEGIVMEDRADTSEGLSNGVYEARTRGFTTLSALQLSTDHSTSIEEEIIRIKNEHPDDSNCIVNDRVKGRLKVTRAFGAGFLKQRKMNDALFGVFRNDYIGNVPYISCSPSLRHHKLSPRDQFLVLSSDGLYQYFTNQEVVSHVLNFMDKFPEGDPAQHLIEELLSRAARKAGMDFHELLDIPQGDRRKYHDDVTVMVVSLEGRIWKSSGKYL